MRRMFWGYVVVHRRGARVLHRDGVDPAMSHAGPAGVLPRQLPVTGLRWPARRRAGRPGVVGRGRLQPGSAHRGAPGGVVVPLCHLVGLRGRRRRELAIRSSSSSCSTSRSPCGSCSGGRRSRRSPGDEDRESDEKQLVGVRPSRLTLVGEGGRLAHPDLLPLPRARHAARVPGVVVGPSHRRPRGGQRAAAARPARPDRARRLPRSHPTSGDAPCRTGRASCSPSAPWPSSRSTCVNAARRRSRRSAPLTASPGRATDRRRFDGRMNPSAYPYRAAGMGDHVMPDPRRPRARPTRRRSMTDSLEEVLEERIPEDLGDAPRGRHRRRGRGDGGAPRSTRAWAPGRSSGVTRPPSWCSTTSPTPLRAARSTPSVEALAQYAHEVRPRRRPASRSSRASASRCPSTRGEFEALLWGALQHLHDHDDHPVGRRASRPTPTTRTSRSASPARPSSWSACTPTHLA